MQKTTTTSSDVQRIATEQIAKNGSTTTLYVKKELRAQGFFATQESVSKEMRNLKAAGIFTSEESSNGEFQIYSLTQSAILTPKPNVFIVLFGKAVAGIKNAIGIVKAKIDSLPRYQVVRVK